MSLGMSTILEASSSAWTGSIFVYQVSGLSWKRQEKRILMGLGQAATEGILQPREAPPPQLGHFVINSLGTGSSVGLSTRGPLS